MIAPPLAQLRQRRLAEVEYRQDIGAESPPDLLAGEVGQALVAHLEGGVIDQDIQVAELLHRPPHERLAVRLVADIPGDRERLSPGVAYQARGLRCVLILAQVGDATSAPSRAKARATARPIPESPPVISATLPVRRLWPW